MQEPTKESAVAPSTSSPNPKKRKATTEDDPPAAKHKTLFGGGFWDKDPNLCKMAQNVHYSILNNPLSHKLWRYREGVTPPNNQEWMDSLQLLHQFTRSSGLDANYVHNMKEGLTRIHNLHKTPRIDLVMQKTKSAGKTLIYANEDTDEDSSIELKTRDILLDIEMKDTILPFMVKAYSLVVNHIEACDKCQKKCSLEV